jgi:alkylation response protein AidB-like acyl-CoA dehydrogenase
MRGSPTAELFFDNVEIPDGKINSQMKRKWANDQKMYWVKSEEERQC